MLQLLKSQVSFSVNDKVEHRFVQHFMVASDACIYLCESAKKNVIALRVLTKNLITFN